MNGPLRVERALKLLPSVEAVEPLRILLLSIGEPDAARLWSSAGPYQTVGKRSVDVDALRTRVANMLPRVAEHVSTLYESYLKALQAWHAGDGATAALALAAAGDAERATRRKRQAISWYEVAFHVASELTEREPEIAVLARLGDINIAIGNSADAARYFQRLLVLAEAGFDHDAVILACHGLGRAAIARQHWEGAVAWCMRGLRHAAGGDYPLYTAQLEASLALAAWHQGNIDEAQQRLRHARDVCEIIDAAEEMARVLATRGRVELGLGKADAAVASLREALAWTRRPNVPAALRVDTSIALADAHVAAGNMGEAERELRSAEQLAVDGRLTDRLVDVYVAMGKLCGARDDETGFVFFEQAIALCMITSTGHALEGRVYEEYGVFRQRFGQRDEAQAHYERAVTLFEAAGDEVSISRLRQELASISA
ncbi:MAG TPA: tetratricopeptide repeat protein [Gemmatimonadaceae bacterium]